MKADEVRALLQRYVHEVWEKQNPEAVDGFLARDYKRHLSPKADPLDREGQKQLLKGFSTAFPDARLTVNETIVEEDRIAFRSTLRATHKGEFLGIAPTGRQIIVGLVDIIHIEDGKFAEQWGGPDTLDLLRQLGAKVA
jgi:predicted ester cyclase